MKRISIYEVPLQLVVIVGLAFGFGVTGFIIAATPSDPIEPPTITLYSLLEEQEFRLICDEYEQIEKPVFSLTCETCPFWTDECITLEVINFEEAKCRYGTMINKSTTIITVDGDCLSYKIIPKGNTNEWRFEFEVD